MSESTHPTKGFAVSPWTHPGRKGLFSGSLPVLLDFIFGAKANRKLLWVALVGSVVQLIVFKFCYPYPDFISDSYNYIQSAANHLNVNLWPIGYAKFIAFIHLISPSDTLLVATQYILLQISLLSFFYLVKYLYRPPALTTKILFIVLLFNPLSLYISNAVLSDALFITITIIWFSVLLWQLQFPNGIGFLIQVILIGLAFTIRYTAIYYPFVAAIALIYCKIGWLQKFCWMVAPAMLFIPFIRYTQAQTKAVTGTAEFSVFGGWQIANNALYMYDHIQVDPATLPPETRELDQMVRHYYKSAPPGFFNFADFPGTFFIKHAHAPLKQYMLLHFAKQHDTSSFLGWGKVSPVYNKYGTWLISHYPLAFAQYYLWLNTKNYFSPFLEKFDVYNLMSDSVWSPAQDWFHYPSPQITSVSPEFQGKIFSVYPPIFLLLNLYFGGCLIWLWVTRKFSKLDPVFQKALCLLSGFLLINFGFSILATPIVLRYEAIPLVLLFAFSILLFDFTDFKKTSN
jgi:hypothetical protein